MTDIAREVAGAWKACAKGIPVDSTGYHPHLHHKDCVGGCNGTGRVYALSDRVRKTGVATVKEVKP